jgi:carbonic anhydrase/acetyltransferase-like protein (isoleucine patch superfamily)
MSIRSFNNITPTIGKNVYIDEQSAVIGDVVIGSESSIWPFTSVRGDVNKIRIGERCNIQDNSTIHVSHDSEHQPGGVATIIGDDVTVGHQVVLHACTIGNRCLIGMGSVIMTAHLKAATYILVDPQNACVSSVKRKKNT